MPWVNDNGWDDAIADSGDIDVGGERFDDGSSTEFLFRPDQLLCDAFVWTEPRNSNEEDMRGRLRDAGADELSGDDPRTGTAERLGLRLLNVPSDAALDLVRTARDIAPDSVNFNHVLTANPQRYGGCAPPVGLAQSPGVAIPGTEPEGARLKIAVLDTGIAEGVSFVDPASDTEPAGFSDRAAGHGTMVAGAIARTVAGATILVKQVLSLPLGVADELEVAAALDALPRDIDVINASFGGPAADDERMLALQRALERLPEDTVVFASAGNEASDRPHYMAAYDRVLGVASVEEPGAEDYSNRGEWVDLSTQGTDVVTIRAPNAFVQATGTSFAAPKIAAMAMTFPGNTHNVRAAIQWLIANGGQVVPGRGTFIDLPEVQP